MRDIFVTAISNPFKFIFESQDRLSILKNISFKISRGEIVGIIGINGVGKTSLCRYLSGVHPSKEIKLKGEVRAVFDTNVGIFPDLTGRENVELLAELLFSKVDKITRAQLIENAISFSDIGEFIDTPFKNYSRGMKARLYLSLVTSLKCDLLILDEVFGGTDVFFTEKLSKRVSDLISQSGAAIMVSHSAEEIQTYCNRLILLSEKGVLYDGDVKEGITKYLNLKQ